ncbi:MAG: hypothetical protein GEU95_27600 [Rhizobiales bacterium]|nr:hypothetical protein [Hyphomicrobiales bacterium]
MIHYVRLQLRRLATGLAAVAALAFVLDGALGAHHHLPIAAGGGHYHAHAHSHAPADASAQQAIDNDIAAAVDLAAAQQDSAPDSSLDANSSCCFVCGCSVAVVPPSLTAQAVPFVLLRIMASAHRRHGDGIVPEGLRRPPRPLDIA